MPPGRPQSGRPRFFADLEPRADSQPQVAPCTEDDAGRAYVAGARRVCAQRNARVRHRPIAELPRAATMLRESGNDRDREWVMT